MLLSWIIVELISNFDKRIHLEGCVPRQNIYIDIPQILALFSVTDIFQKPSNSAQSSMTVNGKKGPDSFFQFVT